MATKPFIAARIPEDLNTRLEEHSESTGERRTQALINALAKYLNFAPSSKNEESAGDRLSILEKKVTELESILKEPRQISFLDVSSSLSKEAALPKIKVDNASDNREVVKTDIDVIKSDNTSDNIYETASENLPNELDNRQMSEISKIKYETVRSKHRNETAIEVEGRKYLPKKHGKSCRWEAT